MGVGAKERLEEVDRRMSIRMAIVCAAMAFLSLIIACRLSRHVFDIANGNFSSGVIPQCLAGLIFVFAIARLMETCPCVARLFSWIGRMSLCFFALELLVAQVVGRISGGWLPHPLWLMPHSLFVSIERFFIILLLVSFLVPIVSKILQRIQRVI